jgi:hypothetical protein
VEVVIHPTIDRPLVQITFGRGAPMLRVLIFVVFLGAYGLWTYCALVVSKKLQADSLVGKTFWAGQFMAVLGMAGFFGFEYLLSGWRNWGLIAIFFAASELGAVMSLLLGAILGEQSEKTLARLNFISREIGTQHVVAVLVATALSLLVTIAFPIAAGVLYFTHPRFSPALAILIVKCYLILLVLGNLPLMMTVVVGLLASQNLDEDTRQGLFVAQLCGLVPTALYVALGVSAFSTARTGVPFAITDLLRAFPLRTALVMVGFFIVLILLPYLSGTQRAKRFSLHLVEQRRQWLDRVIDILESPIASQYVPRLTRLKEELVGEQAAFSRAHPVWTPEPQDEQSTQDAFLHSRDLDPRLCFLDQSSWLQNEIQTVVDDLQGRTAVAAVEAAGLWSKKYEARRFELTHEIETVREAKPLVTAGIGVVTMAILSGILGKVGEAGWLMISRSAPK